MVLWCRQMKYHLVQWNSMELWDFNLFKTMLPWTHMGYCMELWSCQIKKTPSSMGFHGIRRAPFEMTQVFHGIPWNIPWNSKKLCSCQMKYNLVPMNSMEYSMECHGTLVPPKEILLSSMEFNGTLRLSFYSTPCYPGFSWEIWSRQIQKSPSCKWEGGISNDTGVPWNSMDYSME